MVIALVGLIFILLLVFVLIIRGQSKKYAKKADSGERAAPAWHVSASLLEGVECRGSLSVLEMHLL